MDFESPDVEKDFPGLYASESGRKSNESDFSDGGDHEKPSKKDLLGRRKDKKEKKDRGYAALEGESSPEEDTDTKSPSKTKKTKSFKFPTKSKEKREKSRDKEKVVEDTTKQKELSEKEKKKEREREKEREKEKKEKEKREKLREKDKEKEEKAKFKLESKEKLKDDKKEKVKDKDKEKVKEKDKEKVKEKEKEKVKEKEKEKVKEKDKEKKDKKLTKMPSTVTSGIPFEEIFTLGVALPIFGVPLHQSVERSRCHDDTGLPLVMRDSIDFLQAHGLKSPQIYRTEPDKIKLQQLRKLYTDRGPTFPYHWDVPVACAMLKTFISELPESILTQELFVQFEQATALGEPAREAALRALVLRLPANNHAALGWLLRHLHDVLAHEAVNHATMSVICSALCPSLGVSNSLLAALVSKADKLFPDVRLTKYVPPLLSIPSDFPETSNEISEELRKQESLLNQIHFEMHAGFITSTRDQQLWEAQRIVTQLKRKLRSVQKSVEPNAVPTHQPSIEEMPEEEAAKGSSQNEPLTDEVEVLPQLTDAFPEVKESPNDPPFPVEFEDNFEFKPNKDCFEFKPPKDSFDFKAAKDSLDFKPPNDSFDFKAAKDSLDFKPPNDNFDFKAVKDSLDFKPPKDSFDFKAVKDSLDFKPPKDSFDFKAAIDSLDFKPPKDNFDFKPDEDSFDFKQAEDKFNFPTTEDEFDFKPTKPKETENEPEPIIEKPKFTDKELQVLRLQLENAEYLQLKSLLQAKINSEQFEIVKLRSHVTLKNKQEGNIQNNKENKDSNTPEEQELKQKLIKENAILEQKRLNLLNQIFQERVACIHLKIELAMKEILKS